MEDRRTMGFIFLLVQFQTQLAVLENDNGPYPKFLGKIAWGRYVPSITYKLSGPGADEPPEGLFTINKRSGLVYVTKPLDREKKAEYRFVHVRVLGAKAEEPMEPILKLTDVIILVIDQNDNKPVFSQDHYHGNVSEGTAIDHSFMRVTAVDLDDPETYNGIISYRILTQVPALPRPAMFDINPVSGVISVAAAGLDRETHPKYTLVIEAADLEGVGHTANCTAIIKVIDQNDNKPVFSQDHYHGNVSEGTAIDHSFMRVTAVDLDDPETYNGIVSYRILTQVPALPRPAMFDINPVSGVISVAAAGLDRETHPKYTLVIEAADLEGVGHTANCTAIIKVIDQNDNKPVFSQDPYHGNVSEGTAIDHSFMRVTAVDLDDPETYNGIVSYRILTQVPALPRPAMFDINPVSGVISVAAAGLDRETHPKYTLVIEAADLEGVGHTANCTAIIKVIDQNDNKPVFSQDPYHGNVSEGTAIDHSFMRVTAVDLDDPETYNGIVSYRILTQVPALPRPAMFDINPVSGVISVAAAGLDRETHPKYTLVIEAADLEGVGHTANCTAIIKVIDQNDNKPVFSQDPYHGNVSEGTAIDHSFMRVTAVDLDDPETYNGIVSYRILTQVPALPRPAMFDINPVSGVISVAAAGLDRETHPKYTLVIEAADLEGVGHTANCTAIIKVIDQNDNKPVFSQDPYHGNVSEGTAIDHSFMRVTAVDLDDPETYNGIVRYRILIQVPALPRPAMFDINPVSGVISVAAAGLDRETHRKYTLVIEAADLEGVGHTANCTAIIKVIDSNDHAPQFTVTDMSASVPENGEPGVEVARLKVTDQDELGSPNANTKYSIIRGNKGGHFAISTGPGNMEGILTTAKELDFESVPVFTLLVVVENEAGFSRPVTTSTATVTVRVEDKNEPPVFSPAELHVSRSEDLTVGGTVAQCKAQDPDTARSQAVRFELSNDTAHWLNINIDTGLIKVKSRMDRESTVVKDGKYTVLILAYDNDPVPATSTGTLLLNLLDVNDNAPLIRQRHVVLCNEDPLPALLDIVDPDGPGYAGPFTVELQAEHRTNWTISTNSTSDVAALVPKRPLSPGDYSVLMRVYDAGMLHQDSTLDVEVCQCRGFVSACVIVLQAAPRPPPGISSLGFGALGFIFGSLLVLLLPLLLILRRRRRSSVKTVPLLEEEARDNLFYYDEEGGGEEDQNYDLSQLPFPLYRSPPRESEEIGNFIEDNLYGAHMDPTAPPYDCLLVFDYEGEGSNAGSLSTICSSSSEEEPDYRGLYGWGPRFSRLADLYTTQAEEEDDDDTETLPGKTDLCLDVWMSVNNIYLEK